VRGLAHIGVLSALERAGIPIDCVAGTSVGALIGAAYCAGLRSQELEEIALRIRWRDIASLTWPTQGLIIFDKLERWITSAFGDLSFADLKIPLGVAVSDMEKGQPLVLREGRLAPAIHASCAVPGIVKPVRLNGRLLGDGGITNNLPVSVVREMGADYVIGVAIFASSVRRRWGGLGLGFTAIEIMTQRAGGGLEAADCLIAPALAGLTYWRFSKAAELIGLGEKAAEDKLPLIQAALGG
jgi:NTE family protein